ncbi:hypothetical protein [Micromonospora sp. C28ISP2-4]|uniref:hypothetical protein n=1 Tax=Micromonospora sp. C28ISP2-4 TaxID=3059523 RepID=UPI002675C513|nr:hypothetical protein [Micromonospora sp. C28ISP2-4]MDO3685744.1 hypothetical protein [Micromonospora sp. C28ISP2-4]
MAQTLWVLCVVLLNHYNEDAPVTYNGGSHGAKPYRCKLCRRIGLTTVPRPQCFGRQGDAHDAAPMERMPEKCRDQAVKLIIR